MLKLRDLKNCRP